jgi:nitrate/nitrite transport system ATP-binding protein
MALLELRNVSKAYASGATRTEVLAGVNLEIEEGELVAIVGFSGSGKTTLINLMAGLAAPDGGEVLLRGKPIRGPGPDRGVVFQNYSLLPWLSVRGNVALAVDCVHRTLSPRERAALIERFVAMVSLTPALEKKPGELSGGMRQRVAVARALAMNPEVLLLDEPLAALDALTRSSLQDEIEWIFRRDRKTVVLITNDVDEAVLLGDRIVPLTPGPRATLGPSFPVALARPRDRTMLNRDPEFRRLRNGVLSWLIDARKQARSAAFDATAGKVEPPAARPLDLTMA